MNIVMRWKEVENIEMLKGLGKLNEIAKIIQEEQPDRKVPKKSWKTLYEYVLSCKEEPIEQAPEDVVIEQQNIFSTVKSLEQLKLMGSFAKVREKAIAFIGDEAKSIRGWEKLYQKLVEEKVIAVLENTQKQEGEKVHYSSVYFQSEASEIIFYLLELDGEVRLKKLGVTRRYYRDKALASGWKNKVMKIIHPDQTNHDKAEEATKELNELYRSMIQFAK